MSDIRKSLESLANTIEKLEESKNQKPVIHDRSLSGNKITGGKITAFSSQGIEDKANTPVLTIDNNGIHSRRAFIEIIEGTLTIQGDLDLKGNLISDDLNKAFDNKSTLELVDSKKSTFDEGILWRNKNHTSQLVLKDNPHRIWTNENFDLAKNREYRIANQTVLTENSLGSSISESKLKTVGRLRGLDTAGTVTVGDVIRLDCENENISIGTEDPTGFFTIDSFDHKFVIDYDNTGYKLGTYSSSNFAITTDDVARITINATGKITIEEDSVFKKSLSIGAKNPLPDVDLTIAGALRFQNTKHERLSDIPESGNYQKGDVVWNTDPKPTGFIGWVCVREGTPGEWKGFGQISS